MLDILLSDAYFWFSAALATVAILFVLELIGLIFGISLIGMLDDIPNNSVDLEIGSAFLPGSLLYLNRIPLLIWLVVFLTLFGLLGYIVNFATERFFNVIFPLWLSITGTGVISLITTSKLSKFIAQVLPKLQSSAEDDEDFIGAVALITIGSASKGNPAEARFIDRYAQPHYVLVEPLEEHEQLLSGEQIVLVQKNNTSWLARRYLSLN